jgi:protoheme IX farnesyltransferase
MDKPMDTLESEARKGFDPWAALRAYIEVTKPASVLLLVFTAIATLFVAAGGHPPLTLFLQVLIAATAGCAGANAITCYIDRDIDVIMERTKGRPLPAKKIHPPEKALYWGAALTLVSFTIAWHINALSFLCATFGLFDNVLVYSLLAKRRSPLNVILGGFSGGIPALFGWAAATGEINASALLIAGLVVLWIPNHIWNLAIFYSEDYKKVKVPMLPAVFTLKGTLRCILATIVLLYLLSIALGSIQGFGPIYWIAALGMGTVLLLGNICMFLRPSPKTAWTLFKLSGPYLLALFGGMLLDVWLVGSP